VKGKFDPEVVLLKNGKVRVAGPFDPGDDEEIDTASVLFLIVQGEGGPDTVIVQGEASWKRDPSKGKDQRWETEVSAKGKRAGGGDGELQVDPQHPRVRGIAFAVAVQPVTPSKLDPDKFDPPAFESLTWCADSDLVAEKKS
jgi:hypothetical protein